MTLADHLKSLGRHSSVYTISTFLQRALGLIMLPLYTNLNYIPSKEALADQALVYTFIAFMTILFLYGLDSAVLRYFFLGEFERRDVYTTAFFALVINVGTLSTLIFLFSKPLSILVLNNNELFAYIRLAALILIFDTLANMSYLILRAEEKSILYSGMRITRFILELCLNIIFLVYMQLGVIGILYANLLASLINFLMLFPFQWQYLKGRFSFSILKSLLAFGLPMIPNGLAYLVVEVSDKYVMLQVADKSMVGTYAPNRRWGSLLLLIVMGFRTAWQPFFLKVAKEKNARQIYARVLTYFLFALTLLIIWGGFFIEYLVKIPLGGRTTVMGSEYWDGLSIIPLILTSYLFYGIYVNMTIGIYIKKKTKYMAAITGAAALSNIMANLYLIPLLGVMGAALAAVLSYAVMALLMFAVNQRIYPVPYEYARILILLLLLMGFLGVYYTTDLSLWIKILISLVLPVALALGGFFRKTELRQLLAMFKKHSG